MEPIVSSEAGIVNPDDSMENIRKIPGGQDTATPGQQIGAIANNSDGALAMICNYATDSDSDSDGPADR